MGHNLILFEEKNYLPAKNELVKGVCINPVFFITFLIVYKEDINHNHRIVRCSGMLAQFQS